MRRVVHRSGKASIIVMILAGIIGVGALFTIVYGGRKAVEDLVHRENLGFASLCDTPQ